MYLVCKDTPGCQNDMGKSCSYVSKYNCSNGKVGEYSGRSWQYPEKNCCKCGKGKGMKISYLPLYSYFLVKSLKYFLKVKMTSIYTYLDLWCYIKERKHWLNIIDAEEACDLPFTCKGKKYYSCTTAGGTSQPWCFTAAGNFLTGYIWGTVIIKKTFPLTHQLQ